MSLLLQQRYVIRYFVLRGKSNQQIAAKLAKGYGLDALCLRAVQKWAVGFRAGQHDVENDDRSGRPPQTALCDALLCFLEKPALFMAGCQQGALYPKKQQFSEYSLASG
jgi:transposase